MPVSSSTFALTTVAQKILDVYPGEPVVLFNGGAVRMWASQDQNFTAPIPINPFASSTWSARGPLYAKMDSGTGVLYTSSQIDEIQPSPVDIAVQVALQLLASGVPFIDRPELISFAFPSTLVPGASNVSPTFDVSKFSSYYSWWGWSPVVGEELRVTYSFIDPLGQEVENDQVVFNGQGAGSPTSFGGGFLRGPMRGAQMVVTAKNEGGINGDYNFGLFGSLRNVQAVRAIEKGITDNVMHDADISPGASATATVPFCMFSGEVGASIQAVGTAGQSIRVRLLSSVSSGVLFDKTYVIGTTPADYGLRFIFPRSPLVLTVQNLGASGINGIRTAWYMNEPA